MLFRSRATEPRRKNRNQQAEAAKPDPAGETIGIWKIRTKSTEVLENDSGKAVSAEKQAANREAYGRWNG